MTQEDLATDDVMILDTWDQVDKLACGIFWDVNVIKYADIGS